MIEVNIREYQRKMAHYLDLVECGEPVVVLRRGHPPISLVAGRLNDPPQTAGWKTHIDWLEKHGRAIAGEPVGEIRSKEL